MELTLINVGRNNVNKTISIKNEAQVLKEVKKCLGSKQVDLTPIDDKGRYGVYVGVFRKVGEIIVKP